MTLKTKLALTSAITWILCLTIFLLSVYVLDANEVLNTKNWVARCGTIILVIAALSEWTMLRRIERYRQWTLKSSLIPKESKAWFDAKADIEKQFINPVRAIAEWSNIFLLIAGTVLNGFGDLIYQSTYSPIG
ncbi:hypothetical protein [Vibrio cionasavignyae]|uniref:hypothetical protein n=1 Tax=Vibrio cionasavignyae TaxID=2910252 RepID=UPI003D096AC5